MLVLPEEDSQARIDIGLPFDSPHGVERERDLRCAMVSRVTRYRLDGQIAIEVVAPQSRQVELGGKFPRLTTGRAILGSSNVTIIILGRLFRVLPSRVTNSRNMIGGCTII